MTIHQLIFPLTDKNGKDQFLVSALLPERSTKQVEHNRARLVDYFTFGHPDLIKDYRETGYVLVDKVKGRVFGPKVCLQQYWEASSQSVRVFMVCPPVIWK